MSHNDTLDHAIDTAIRLSKANEDVMAVVYLEFDRSGSPHYHGCHEYDYKGSSDNIKFFFLNGVCDYPVE